LKVYNKKNSRKRQNISYKYNR